MPSSITPDGARSEIAENAMKVGNPVKTAAGLATQTSKILVSDTSSNMSTLGSSASQNVVFSSGVPAVVTPATVVQPTNTEVVFDVSANGVESLLTGSIVNIAGGSTVTQVGALRILVTDSSSIGATTGSYYIPFGTLA